MNDATLVNCYFALSIIKELFALLKSCLPCQNEAICVLSVIDKTAKSEINVLKVISLLAYFQCCGSGSESGSGSTGSTCFCASRIRIH
jgi:hypothetical protein